MEDMYDKFIRTRDDFPIKGVRFRDITPLLANGNAFSQAIADLAKELPPYDRYDKIVVAESRGFIFGAPLAAQFNKGLVLVRKPGKLPIVGKQISYSLEYGSATFEIAEGTINPGDRCIVVDDLVATGGSCKAMIDLIKDCGGTPVMCLFLIELRSLQGYKLLDVPVKSIMCYGLHKGDMLQIERSNKESSYVIFDNKKNDEELYCHTKDGNKDVIITKSQIINIVQEDKDGRLSYIKYRD